MKNGGWTSRAFQKEVAPFHMAATVNDLTNEMTFLYKFLPGLCPASHGHNVAKIAGLPEKAAGRSGRCLVRGIFPGISHGFYAKKRGSIPPKTNISPEN